MSSPQSPDLDDDVHQMWPSRNYDTFPVGVYREFLLTQFTRGGGAIVGPNDWYLSRAEAYKHTKRVQHERFVATIERTPRLPKPSAESAPASHAEDIRPVYLTIERSMDRNQDAEGSSGLGANSPAAQTKEDEKRTHSDASSLSDSSKDSFHSAEFLVKFSHGAKPAHDKVSYKSIISEAGKYELLGSIDFPAPSAMLPHEEDSDAVFTELLMNSDNDQIEGPSSRTLCTSTHPLPFVSLPTLISLADTIGKHKPLYTLTKNNCYWFCSTLFFALRQYTSSEISVPVAKKPSIIIKPDDDVKTIKKAFKTANLDPGHYGIFEIMSIPTDEEIENLLKIWAPEQEKLDKLYRTRRLKRIQADREKTEKAVKEEKEKAERAIKEKEKVERVMKEEKERTEKMKDKQRQDLRAMGWNEEKILWFFRE
ncbi:hypothetical protein Agabi119p4_6846 [Agaricus bisporus var. burnettii]|uniref:Uncharacterized protein n=1 Tax=Agaricus bisporus var. burnettii TaxID=192524 RepID=A0A8H7F0B0_AGABI|nr:hypothetical protein Agabi119p4_6846 [Agaricus bisporus var. burnettii]